MGNLTDWLGFTVVCLIVLVSVCGIGYTLDKQEQRKPVIQNKQPKASVLVEAQAVATAEDERLAQDHESRSVMQAFEQVAAAAWCGESEGEMSHFDDPS